MSKAKPAPKKAADRPRLRPGDLASIKRHVADQAASADDLVARAKKAGDLKVEGRALKLKDDALRGAMIFKRLSENLDEMDGLREMVKRQEVVLREMRAREQRERDHMNDVPKLLVLLGEALRQPETTVETIRQLMESGELGAVTH